MCRVKCVPNLPTKKNNLKKIQNFQMNCFIQLKIKPFWINKLKLIKKKIY